jgi:hypothetical protein
VTTGVYKGVTTTELDELAAETAASLTATHPDYALLAARIAVSNLHKNTLKSFSETARLMHGHVSPKNGQPAPLVADDVFAVICEHAARLDSEIVYDRDFDYDYFGFKTLERSYLLRVDGRVVERPQHMLMRVSVGIHKEDVDAAVETYHLLSQRMFTHASPTLFNAGTPRPQLSSCFLIAMKGDSIEGIYDTLKECASISKSAGVIGLSIHNVRATGSYIRGTNGTSNGIVPMLRVFNDTARYVDQGGGKRKGAFAIYLEPWHADVFDWLELRKNHGKEEARARDLFYGLWIPDLFMKRVEVRWAVVGFGCALGALPLRRINTAPLGALRRRAACPSEKPSASRQRSLISPPSTHHPPQPTHRPAASGRSSARTRRPASLTAGAPSSRRSTRATRPRAARARSSRRRRFGSRSSRRRCEFSRVLGPPLEAENAPETTQPPTQPPTQPTK